MGEFGQLEAGGEHDLRLGRSRRAELLKLAPRQVALARQLAHLLAIQERQADGEEQAQHEGDGQADHEWPSTIPRRVVHTWPDGVLGGGHGGSRPVSSQLRLITPQAMRAPLLPVGSVFSSSCCAWITRLVPPSPKSEPAAPLLRVTAGVIASRLPLPAAPITRFGRSPAWEPSGLRRPCLRPVGLKCAPAETKSGGSHLPTACTCTPFGPGGRWEAVTWIRTPSAPCVNVAVPTC